MKKEGFNYKFLKGSAWAVFVRIFTVISNLLLNMLLARLLAPEQVGVFFVMASVASVIAVISLVGLNVAIVKVIAKSVALGQHGIIRSAVVKSHIIVFCSTFLLALFLYFIGYRVLSDFTHGSAIQGYELLFTIWIIFWSFENLNSEILRGFKQFHLAVLFKRLAPNIVILIIASVVYFTNIRIDLSSYLHIVVIGWLSSVILSSIVLRNIISKHNGTDVIKGRKLLSLSIPLWFTSWISLGLQQIDLWILALYQDPEIVALYGAASRLTHILGIPLLVTQSVVPPLIAETHAHGKIKELARGLQTVSAISFFPGFILCLIYIYAGEMLLTLIYGDYYSDAETVLTILTLGMVIKLLSGNSQSLLNMTGFEKSSMIISIVTGLFLVLGCLMVADQYGMIGIAVITALSIIFNSSANLIVGRVHLGIWTLPILRMHQIRRVFKML